MQGASQWFSKVVAILAIALLGVMMVANFPTIAQDNLTAPIILDGRRILNVSESGSFSASQRAEAASKVLNEEVRSSDAPIAVTIEQESELPVIKVNGAYLLSVTAEDVPAGKTLAEQAQQWSVALEQAIERAQQERSPNYLSQAAIRALGWILLAFVLSWALGWFWRRWLCPFVQRLSVEPTESLTESPKSLAIGTQVILTVLRAIIWLTALVYISDLFPQTRRLGQGIQRTITNSLTANLVPLGGESYSVIDILRLIGLFVVLMLIGKTFKRILRSRVLSLTGLSRASQETVAAISNYIFIFIGTIVVLQLWGLELSSLTVFAGVVGVGIGLGLQGIAKEFISGLTIIFERPIQVGDFVDVSGLVGTVERIGVRSTTIVTLDQIAVILPNSRFLESEVINWTHQNPISRLKIPLGVAYGSHLETVRSVLLEAAQDHADVLAQPAPSVFFQGFGDSSLDFNLLVWIVDPARQFRIKSDLYFAIEAKFRDRGVEIPFPQRDLHLRSGTLELSPQVLNSLSDLSRSLSGWIQKQPPPANGRKDKGGEEL
jgi:potassium efflux system protein